MKFFRFSINSLTSLDFGKATEIVKWANVISLLKFSPGETNASISSSFI